MSEIRFIPGIASPSVTPGASAPKGSKEGGASFVEELKKAVSEVTEAQKTMDASINDLQVGKAGLHETLIHVEKADISFKLLMQVRNKMLEAYKEVMRMNV